jgi:PAS domain S-box-containing protein
MTDNLRRSIDSGNGSSQNMAQGIAEAHDSTTAKAVDSPDRQSDLALDIQALQILDSSDDCIKVLDLDGRILFMSRGGQVLLGIQDSAPFLHTSWIGFWQRADQQVAVEAIAKARAGDVCTFQGYCPTPSGEPKWWEIKVSPIRGREGQVERLLCISRDITERRQIEDERKQAEEKLRESEERYRAIINQAVTGVACTDLDGTLTLVNQKYCDITGYSADELIQRRMQDITHPEDLPRNIELFHRMRTDGTPFEIEKRYIRKDGSIVWVNNSVSVIRDSDGNPQSAVAISLDITGRKQAALSSAFLATATQNLAEATCVEDIIQTIGEQLNQYLQTSICAFVEINESAEVAEIHHSWHQKDVPSLVGVYQLAEFVTDEFFQTAKDGQTIIVRDVTTDPRIADSERFARLKIGSFINVPLIRDNEWKFTLGIYHQTPYNWRNDEIELMRELSNRIWTKLERTRVEIALRQSREMFSTLVTDAPFGVYMVDAEFRFRQANQTAASVFNIQPLIGCDLTEALRTIWQEPFATEAIDRFRHTLATGEPYYSPPMVESRADIAEIQSYDWQLHRITLPDGSYGVVCYFYDLSEIKRAEEIIRRNADRDAFLVSLNDTLRPLTNAAEIQAIAARILGEYLGATRVIYIEVVSDGEEVIVHSNYVNGVAELSGRYRLEDYRRNLIADHQAGRTQVVIDIPGDPKYTEAEKARYRAIDIAAHIDVPLLKNNQFVALLAAQQSTPRQWTELEVNLVEETAERTWAAVERARAEAALRESEAKYRSLFESIDEGFCIFEMLYNEAGEAIDFRYIETNPAFERQSGRKPQPGQTMRELFPEVEDMWLKDYAEVARTGQPKRFIDFHESLDRWFDVFVFPMNNGNNQLAALFSDVTDEKRAEAALRESEARLQKAISIETVGVLFFTLDGHITDANDTFLRMSGYSRDELRNIADWHDLTPPEFWDVTSSAAEDLVALGITAPYEKQHIRKDGSRWWGLFSPMRLKGSGRNAECVEFVIDISEAKRVEDERKQAEAAIAADLRDTQLLRELSARLATEENIQALYQEIMAVAIVLTQADAGTVQILDETTQDLVLLATQGIEQKMAEHFHRVNASSNTPCGIALRSGVRSFVDFDVPASEDPDGSMRLHVEGGLLSAQSTPLLSRSGKPIGMVSTHWRTHHQPGDRELRFLDLLARQAADLIEQRQDEAQRRQLLEREQAAREEAERANRVKDEFLAVLSHELRSPLNPILGWTRLLQAGKLDETRQREALATIERNAKLQTQLIEDLLDISRIIQGKLSLTVAPVNLTFVITAAVETVRLAAEAKQIQILLDLTTAIAPVSGDAARLQQVVWNLLSNAVKFTPTGGRVEIGLSFVTGHRSLVEEQITNDQELMTNDKGLTTNYAQITVSDTGQGITPEFLPHVFEYFRQADATTTRKFGGLGLGLAIVRQIVEMHGGTVKAESPGENQGATFTVQLPVMQQTPSTVSEPSYAEAATQETPLSNLQILVVDDDDDTREFQAFLLEQNGARVTAVASGLEALQVLDQCIPDVLVSDVGMAQMDGYMLIQQIRSRPGDRGGMIPAIALTAYAAEVDQQKALQAGFQTHITKPVDPEALLGAIVSLLRSDR